MLHRTIKGIHHYRIWFLLVFSVFFLAYLGLNPLDLSKYYGARFGSAIGMSTSIPENPVNKLALDLKQKEDRLNERERQLNDKEAALGNKPDRDEQVTWLMGGGIVVLFLLITVNFFLDRQYRKRHPN